MPTVETIPETSPYKYCIGENTKHPTSANNVTVNSDNANTGLLCLKNFLTTTAITGTDIIVSNGRNNQIGYFFLKVTILRAFRNCFSVGCDFFFL